MKVRLLGSWNGNDKGKIIDVSPLTADRLVLVQLGEVVQEKFVAPTPPEFQRETATISPPEVREEKSKSKKQFFKRGK